MFLFCHQFIYSRFKILVRLLHDFYIFILFNCHCPKDGQVIDVEVKVKLWWLHHFGFTLFQLPRMRSKIVNYFLQLKTSHSWKWKWPRISDIKNNFTCLIIWVSLTIFSSFTIVTFCMHLLILVQHMAPPQILPISQSVNLFHHTIQHHHINNQ